MHYEEPIFQMQRLRVRELAVEDSKPGFQNSGPPTQGPGGRDKDKQEYPSGKTSPGEHRQAQPRTRTSLLGAIDSFRSTDVNSLTMYASRYVDITGVVWNSVLFQVGSSLNGTLGPGHEACYRREGMHPLPCPAPQPRTPWGAGFPRLCGPRTHPLTYGQHVGQGCEVVGVDEGDVKPGFHGWLVKAWEGLPGVCRLHLRRGQHPAHARVLEGLPAERLCW